MVNRVPASVIMVHVIARCGEQNASLSVMLVQLR